MRRTTYVITVVKKKRNESGANSMTTQVRVVCRDTGIAALNKMQLMQHSVVQVVRIV